MECFICSKNINVNDDHFYVNRKSNKRGLFFHIDCFEANAGQMYSSAMTDSSKKCYLCNSTLAGTKNICRPCQSSGPKCVRCSHEMTLRFAKQTGKPFWGCTSFPTCKTTQPYFEPSNKEFKHGICQTEIFVTKP